MSYKLFWNVNVLYEQIETQYADRSPEEGPGAQMAVRTSLEQTAWGRQPLTTPFTGILRLHLRVFGLLPMQIPKQ